MRRGNRCRSLAHAETDFENPRRDASEQRLEVDRRRAIGHADAGHHLLVITLLGIRNAPLAAHETADMPGRPGRRDGVAARHA
jgi:hypothetical protein